MMVHNKKIIMRREMKILHTRKIEQRGQTSRPIKENTSHRETGKEHKKENDDRETEKRTKTLITTAIKRKKLGILQHLAFF